MLHCVASAIVALMALCAANVASAGDGADCDFPEDEGLERIAWRILQGNCRLVLRGDSISSDGGSHSLAGGIRRTWRPWRWVGDLTQAHSATTVNGTRASFGEHTCESRNPGEIFSGGQRSINSRPAKDLRFGFEGVVPNAAADVTRASLLIDAWDDHPDLGAQSWLQERMECRAIYWQDPEMAANLRVRATRFEIGVSAGFSASGTPGVAQTPPVYCDPGADDPGLLVYGPVSDALNSENAHRQWAFLGGRFHRVDAEDKRLAGFSLAVSATGGHKSEDLLCERITSDEALQGFYEALGVPNVVMYFVGANDNLYLVEDGDYESNLRAIIDRDRRLLHNLGERDALFLLVSPYEAFHTRTKFLLKARILETIASEFEDVGFLDLYGRAGGVNSSAVHARHGFTRDGVHPTSRGADYFSELMWQALEEWIVPGDVNGDGYRNGLDIAETLSDWGPCVEIATQATDLSGDGVVDAEDLAMLLSHFDDQDHSRRGAACREDLNFDGVVGGADIAILISHWTQHDVPADFHPCVSPGVGADDLAQLLSSWGPCQ